MFNIFVNFTNASGESILSRRTDTGLAFGSREDGLSFGWNRNETANGFDRDAANSPDELHDSFHNMHGPGANNAFWKIAVPNGTYSVHLIAGDPTDTSSLYRINVGNSSTGGTSAINGRATAAKPWLENTVNVTITSGMLFVSNGSGTSNNKLDAIDITPVAPHVTSLSSSSGKPGSTITLTGTNFIGATTVRFNGLATTFKVLSNARINVVVPGNATSGPIAITTTGGTATSTEFKVAPRLSSFSPTTGSPGASVILTGANFTGATSVKFHGLAANFTVDSATQITATVPTNATTGTISISTRAGTATSATNFVVTPRITSFSPTSGASGASVTVTGANFTGATAVLLNGLTATFRVISATQIKLTVPAEATTGQITIITPAGSVTDSRDFVVAPRIVNITPESGSSGNTVTITGANFTSATSVKFHGTRATFTIVSDTEINATVPNSFTSGRITVATPAGAATSSSSFTRVI